MSCNRRRVLGARRAAAQLGPASAPPSRVDAAAGACDGKEGRPLGKLREWGLSVATIHGAMPIGDRDTPGSRIHAERVFKEECQVLVATEAAGEGINLQFCWFTPALAP